jgi:hypothetical protein
MSRDVTLKCAVCQYQTATFGDLVNHPCQQRQLEQQHHLEKRRKSMTTAQNCFEMEQLRQLERFNPADERVSLDAWEVWRQRWDVQTARGAWEGQHEGTYVPYPEALLIEK